MPKTVLITGALNANGRAIAKRFCEDGFQVVLHDADEKQTEEFAKEIGAVSVGGDLCTDEGAQKAVDSVVSACGGIDVLINNAGDYPAGTFEETTADDLRNAFHSNVIASLCVSKAVSANMKKRKTGGHILNASRDNAFTTDKNQFVPSVTAWAMRGTTRATAKQLSKADIKVNAYCVGGDVTPEETANVAAFLASDINADITGQNIMVNNGEYMD